MSDKVYHHLCKVCKSLRRKDIERDYINWVPCTEIVTRYPDENLNVDNIYRHVDHHDNLYDLRSRNAKRVVNRLLEYGLAHVNPADVDIIQIRKLARDLLETEGQIKQGNNNSPTTVNVALIQGQGSDKLCIGAQRFGFGLVELNGANTMPVARETLSIDQSANSTLIEGEYTIDPDPVGPPPNESDVRDVKSETPLETTKISGEK